MPEMIADQNVYVQETTEVETNIKEGHRNSNSGYEYTMSQKEEIDSNCKHEQSTEELDEGIKHQKWMNMPLQ